MDIQTDKEKANYKTPKSLCDSCGNAVPQLCVYMRAKPKDVEAALAAIKAKAVKFSSSRQDSPVYRITDCPKYIYGGLPQIPEVKCKPSIPPGTEKRYDLSCPHCGNAYGIKIAWAMHLKPEDWYCRCTQCNKSFKPRKKEVKKDMELVNDRNDRAENLNNTALGLQQESEKQPEHTKTRIEIVREKLTKERYLAMKAENLSDSAIMKKIFGKYMADTLTKLKKEWGLEGLSLKKLPNQPINQEKPEIKDPEPNTSQEPPTSEKEETEITIGDILDDLITDNVTADDDEEITFITPCKQVKDPILRVCDKGIMFNNSACRLLEGVTSVRVGVTKNRVIVLVPSEPSNKTYKIGTIKNSKQGGLKIGGGVLLAGLKKSGITEGRYRLEKNEAKGRFEARTDEAI